MRKFLSVFLAATMLVGMTACNDSPESSDVVEGGSATAEASATNGDAPESPDVSTTESSVEENIPEIPYELGGELTPTMIANSVLNKGNQARLAKVINKLQAGEEVTIAYLGGSITQGSSAGNDLCYARLTTNWFEENFPSAKINYVNAGIGATGSYIGIHRADKEVLSHNPDLVFIDFTVNDTSDRMAINKATYEGLIRKLWSYETNPAVVCIGMTQEDGTSVQNDHSEIAIRYDIPFISYRNAILDVIDKGYIVWDDISDDNIHPNVPGHAVLTQIITSYIQDVVDNLDSISTEEPALAEPTEVGTRYQNAEMVFTDDPRCTATGVFAKQETYFGGFSNPWLARVSGGAEITGGLEFTVEAQNIGILYGKMVTKGGKLDVYIDGELAKTINCAFPGGWGNYTEFAEIASFDTKGEHTVKLVPQSSDEAAAYYISALTLS